ncbi:hypothetical protein [Tenacibaculum retecalamus]|uniref:hypothetical protein n=1 Tax=Tenacibaculum retecalamus TaxID=3018315 RepID=UPI0023D9483E|nr:hypothetical protein [Tenacibaculum retecalamus]WBX70081.1 hypothetical protein PG912_07185 [Tenacibaculum retecalamus]
MKKVLLLIAIVAAGFTANAQDGQTAKGKFLIEGNTGFGEAHAASTGFSLNSRSQEGVDDSVTTYNLGLEGGYFIMDDLAIKLGLGFGGSSVDGVDSTFSYKIGAKYYISSMIPVQIDYAGNNNDASFLGLQAGYAIFLGDMVSVEPGLRYNLGLGDSDGNNNLQFMVGFALHI